MVRPLITRFTLIGLLLSTLFVPTAVHADEPFTVKVTVQPYEPEYCGDRGWRDRSTYTIEYSGAKSDWLDRYILQYLNGDLNAVSFNGSGFVEREHFYRAYDGIIINNSTHAYPRRRADYWILLFSSTYKAVNVEYLLDADKIVWEIRTELDCTNNKVTRFTINSQATSGSPDDLPKTTSNLVLAVKDIFVPENAYNKNSPVAATIKACQTFRITDLTEDQISSVFVMSGLESITKRRIIVYKAGIDTRELGLIDVPDNYGQPGGAPILDQCIGK